MFTLVVEFGRQRQKFHLNNSIDINILENEIKSKFGIEDENNCNYFIQIYDEQVNDYLDLTSNSFLSINTNNFIKGQIVSRQFNSHVFIPKVTKDQIVGLITLESIENSLVKWSEQIQDMQLEMSKELQRVKETIVAVKSHYRLNEESICEDNISNDPMIRSCSSPSILSQCTNNNSFLPPRFYSNSQSNFNNIPPTTNDFQGKKEPLSSEKTFDQSKYRRNNENSNSRQGIFNTNVPTRLIQKNEPVMVTYQRFQSGVDFQGELSQYYNPTYFFLRISNQSDSYDEMHRDINLYYNSIHSSQTYYPQTGDFCVAKSSNDSNWYRARIIRLVGNEKAQLIYIDTGEMTEMNLDLIQPLNKNFSDRPAQALACTLAQILPITQNERCGWNRRSCMSLENTLKNERMSTGKLLFKVTVDENSQAKWPMMFIHISTPTISSLSEHMSQLYLSRRASNLEISEYWCRKIRPEQYVLFNLSSLINQKQYFVFDHINQSTLSFDLTIDIIIADPEFLSRQ